MKKVSLKKQIKQLQQDLEHKEKSLSDAYSKIYDLEHEQEKKILKVKHQDEVSRYRDENDRLMEIIRWQINPQTTLHPFDKSINEKTQGQKEREGRGF